MKKKEQPKVKEKQFSASPFKALKGVALESAGEQAPAKAQPKQPKSPQQPQRKEAAVDSDDMALFFDAVAGVKPLGDAAPPAARQAQAPRMQPRVDDEEQRVFLKAVEALKMDVRFSEEAPEEELRPTPVNRLRQLRRGGIRVDLELDLHGLTRDEALEHLAPFVRRAYERGQKGVLVITGKGNNSNGEPVLKQAVAGWLREHGKGIVAEFAPAPKEMGGSGAYVIFLKEKKALPEEKK